jgi:hypothetical protein
MSRKQFLMLIGVVFAAATGILGVKRQFFSNAATSTAAFEGEAGTEVSPATEVTDATASGGKAMKFAAATPPASKLLLGQYSGNASESPDQAFIAAFGGAPEITTTYITTQAVNETYEKARVARGTTAVLDLDSKNTPGLIAAVADGTTAGMSYIDTFLLAAERVAVTAPTGVSVMAGYVHEWEVKRAQNVLTNTRDRDHAVYAKAHDRFISRARAIAPHVKCGYWYGHYHTADLATVMAAMNEAPAWIGIDPYTTDNNPFQTAVQCWKPKTDWIKANASYKSFGNPPLYLTEWGVDTFHGDTNCATYMTNLRANARSVGLTGIVHFNRDRTDNDGQVVAYKITNGSTPKTQAAFKASFQAS